MSAEFQLIRNGSIIHQDGNVSQIQGGSFGIHAKQQEHHGPTFSFQPTSPSQINIQIVVHD